MSKTNLTAHLSLRTEFGSVIGDTRIRLLEAIDKHGSIAQAAKRVPLSYKSAWDAVDEMNNLAEQALVNRSIGGPQGGGTRLTDYGRQLIALYRAVEGESQAATDRLSMERQSLSPNDSASFSRLLRRMSMRTTARNQFVCDITDIRLGVVNAQVFLTMGNKHLLQAQVTCDSVSRLALTVGQQVVALVKAPAVLVLADPAARTSASNHLAGVIARIHIGPVSSEIVMDIELAEARHVTAVVSTDAIQVLGLKVGMTVTAAIQASSVILAVI